MDDTSIDGPDGDQSATGDPPRTTGHLRAHDVHGRALARVVGFAALGFGLTVLAAFDVRPTAGPFVQVVLVLAVLLASHVALGALVVVLWVWRVHRDWLPLGGWRLGLLAAIGLAVAGLTLLVDVWLYQDGLDAPWTIAYAAVAVAVSAGGGALTYAAARPDTLTGRGTPRAVLAVQAALGFGLGLVAALGPVVGTSVLRYSRDVPVAEAPVVGMEVRTYAALGDSYSAGEGIAPYLPGTGDDESRCHRSAAAYSQQVPFATPPSTILFVACSGAVTLDATKGFTVGDVTVPPQIGAPDDAVDLVTITMGGNDVLFSRIVTHCTTHDDCTNAVFHPPDEPERSVVTYPAAAPLGRWAVETADRLAPHLRELYGDLREAYPEARIVVLGYPYLFPSGPAGVSLSDCDTVLRMVSEKERTRLRSLQDRFNDIIYEQGVAAGVDVVSPVAIWDGHEPCGDRGQYTNAVKPIVGSPGTFHPNRDGQLAYAALLSCYLEVTEPPSGPGDRVRLPWEVEVADTAPAPGSAERPIPCDGG